VAPLTNLEAILNPEGGSDETKYGLAPRRFRSLDGVRLGLLGNTKLNADAVLVAIGELLRERYAIESVYLRTKPYFGTPAPAEIVQEVIDHSDVVITGIGD
jgi:hypothetical protein